MRRLIGVSEGDRPYNLIFTIPQHFAFKRNPAGGARLTIDIETATVADANRMIDLCEQSAGVIFAAAVVVVQNGYVKGTDLGPPKRKRKAGRKVKPPTEEGEEETW
jgi:hypothetical protein